MVRATSGQSRRIADTADSRRDPASEAEGREAAAEESGTESEGRIVTEAQAEAIARDYLAAGSRVGLCDKHGISPAMLDRILREYRIGEKIEPSATLREPTPYQPFRAPGIELFEKRSSDQREETIDTKRGEENPWGSNVLREWEEASSQ